MWFLGIVALAAAGVLGDYFIKLSGIGNSSLLSKEFFIGFLIYAATAFGWFFVMKHVKLGTLGVFYSVSTILFLVAVGAFYFKETFSVYETLGIAFAIIAIVLLARFS